ncbi:MAG: hypothetical protein J6P29_01380 [Acetobacter sp.]|nr:hypothetical protein [Acetobacter sp.]
MKNKNIQKVRNRINARILRGFRSVCAILEKENAFLIAGQLQESSNLLSAKQKEIACLEEALTDGKDVFSSGEGFSPEVEAEAKRFASLVQTNHKLLEGAIEVQNAIIRLIVTELPQQTHSCYVASGQYVERSAIQGALAVRSDV